MTLEKFEIETSVEVTENIVFNTEKEADNRAKALRRQELDVFLYKKIYTKKGELLETYLVG